MLPVELAAVWRAAMVRRAAAVRERERERQWPVGRR
jgi:hypothetical protein